MGYIDSEANREEGRTAMKFIRPLAIALLFSGAGLLSSCGGAKKPVEPAAAPVLTPREEAKLTGPKKRVGVFEVENKSRYGQNRLSASATDALYSELDKIGRFALYERSRLDQLEKEQKLVEAGKVNPATAARMGELTGIQAAVIGTITQFGIHEEARDYGVYKKKMEIAEATIDVRVVDVNTGRVFFSDSGTGRDEQELKTVLGFGERATFDETLADKALRSAIARFMGRLVKAVDEIPWEGRVADVDHVAGAERVYINAGRRSGLSVGQRIVVQEIEGQITDPVTQEFMGYKTRTLGEGQVEELSGEDLSIARMEGNPGVMRGDLVLLAD
jgi:curli biogenesis system outer membrane secretion channel CsgG